MNSQNRTSRRLFHAVVTVVLTCASGLATPLFATPVDLSPTPLNLTQGVDPNIVVSFDDSGSMLATAMPDNVANSGHFDTKHYYAVSTNVIYFDPNKTYVPPSRPDGTPFPNSTYTNAWRDGMCANWPGTYCYGSANYVDLSENFSEDFLNITSTSNTANDWTNSQECIPDSVSNSDCDPNNDGGGNGGGFYYNCPYVHNDTNCVKVEVNDESATVQQNFANWYSYYRTRNLMTRTSLSRAFANMGDEIRVTWQTINDIPLTDSTEIKPLAGTTDGSWRYDFFTFLYNVHTAGSTPDRRATLRASKFFQRALTGDHQDPYWNGLADTDSAELSCRQNFHMLVTDGYWNWSSDPSVGTGANNYPSGMLTTESDLTLPDDAGFDSDAAVSSIFWNVAGTEYTTSLANIAFHYWATDLQPNLDNDVPVYMQDTTTGVTDTVDFETGDDPLANAEIYWNPANDPATWQHVVQFMVTLGVAGNRAWPDDLQDLRVGDLDWPRPVNNSPEAVDDTWHAAINSRGQYFSASDPDTLVASLTAILQSISARSGSAVASTVNSGVYTSDSETYSGEYDSATWAGTVRAYGLDLVEDADGVVRKVRGAEIWSAGCLLTGGDCTSGGNTVANAVDPDSRSIFTSTDVGADNGVEFLWDNLSADEQLALNSMPNAPGFFDRLGDERLNWLRGDRSNEGLLRTRASVMGAVIRSQPMYVAYPDSGYNKPFPDGSAENGATVLYEQFVTAHIDRTPMLYVGANDGMLHALVAETGEEAFAYVPRSVYWREPPDTSVTPTVPGVPLLSTLTATGSYSFLPTVDNTPTRRDVFFAGEWHTLLVGTLSMGGRGVFALDITDPDTFSASDVLWEFNSTSTSGTGGANLGYTYGQPAIARLATGKWAVLVPGGYFPKDTDDPNHDAAAASNTFSSLFVLDAETGALIRELKTSDADVGDGVVSYGLATPVTGDYEFDLVDDVAFAGDMRGNLWRFDLTSIKPSAWNIDLVYEGKTDTNTATREPLQPITAQPRLFPDPLTNQFKVLFGTGRYLGVEDLDGSSTPIQAIYGIREQGASSATGYPSGYYPIDRSLLQEQFLTQNNGLRYLTNDPVLLEKAGWFINLDAQSEGGLPGERVVARAAALFVTNQALFYSVVPTGSGPCDPGVAGTEMLVGANNGGSDGGIESLDPDPDPPHEHGDPPLPDDPVGKTPDPDPDEGNDPPTTGDSGTAQTVIVETGGCRGVTATGLNIAVPCWRRRSWNVLQ